MRARIYEVKSSAVANSRVLFSPDEKVFFWNGEYFGKFDPGDHIFFVNKYDRWVLHTLIGEKDIPTSHNEKEGTTSFNFDGQDYSVEDADFRFKTFIEFQIQKRAELTEEHEWTSLGSGEVNDLWDDDGSVKPERNRLRRSQQLVNVLSEGAGAELLEDISNQLESKMQVYLGLAAADNGDWFPNAIADLQSSDFVALWWSRTPVGTQETLKSLKKRIQDHGSFDLYYIQKNKARFRARIRDFKTPKDYSSNNWDDLGTVARYESEIGSYSADSAHDAKIVFLADQFERLDSPIDRDRFVFSNGKYGPTQDHIHPFTHIHNLGELNFDSDKEIIEEFRSYLSARHKYASTSNQYISRMPEIGQWFIDHEIVEPSFEVWKDQDEVLRINQALNESHYEAWDELNKDNRYWYSAPWNAWTDFLNHRKSRNSVSMNPLDLVEHVQHFAASKGFRFTIEEIANFYLSLRSKPFVILAGISGTGKTQLPRLFAEAVGMDIKNQVHQVAVRPDWTDGSDLIGFENLSGEFKPQALALAIEAAHRDIHKPHFFLLDEMNLARVEHYFSEFLSSIETRRRDGEGIQIITDTLANGKDGEEITWPQNLFLIGTVNMDETTHSFSRKVLDRANTIEMNEVHLDWLDKSGSEVDPLPGIDTTQLVAKYISSNDLNPRERGGFESHLSLLKEINAILKPADIHFAYRVRDEIAFYMVMNAEFGLLEPEDAMDFQLMQKVLPRIHGSSQRILNVLIELFNLLNGTSFSSASLDLTDVDKHLHEQMVKYPRSSHKLAFMLKRFDEDRFTSFWI